MVTRDIHEYKALIREQLRFLDASCRSFDNGFEGEAKRLATTVRVLVHDTKKSVSLLSQAKLKSGIFIDTAIPLDTRNQMSQSALTEMFQYFDKPPETKAFFMRGPSLRGTTFDRWWDGTVLIDLNGNEFSRKDICLFLSNKEGGAHVDPTITGEYLALRSLNMGWWTYESEHGTQIHAPELVPPTMRQIAAEVLTSLDSSYIYQPELPMVPHARFSGASVISVEPEDDSSAVFDDAPNLPKSRPVVNGKKIGRNDKCVCNSGKKYKHCCLLKT